MGNDGGSIPTRRELVKSAARNPSTSELKATQLEAQTHAWTFCPLSNTPLREPIVSDCLGTLYNKDAVLEHLLPSADSPREKSGSALLPPHIKGLRDIVEVKFTTTNEGGAAGEEAKKICPITSKELGAHTKAVYLVPCGHAFSETAIRELKSDSACVECGTGYEAGNVIAILPLGKEDKSKLEERMRDLREKGLTHSGKKAPGEKKKKKEKERGEKRKLDGREGEEGATADAAVHDAASQKPKPQSQEPSASSSIPQSKSGASTSTPSGIKAASTGIKNASTANLTAKVLDEQEERNKRRKLGMNENLKSLFSNTGYNAHQQKGGDFMTRGFSMPSKKT